MHEAAERILAELRQAPELVDRWLKAPTDEIGATLISAKRVAVLVRQGQTIGYTSAIGFTASYLPFTKSTAKAPWTFVPDDAGETIWPYAQPTPAAIVNWLQWHSLETLYDVITACYPDTVVKTSDEDACRRFIGYRYQLDYFTTTPAAYEQIAGRPLSSEDVAGWRARLATILQAVVRNGDAPVPHPQPRRAPRGSSTREGVKAMETATAPVAPAVVKKSAAVTPAAKGTKHSKVTRKKVTRAAVTRKGSAKPKADRKPRGSAAADEYTKEKLKLQSKLPVGSHHTYNGIRKPFAGKKVKVVGHESRGGIHIELDGKKLTVSPNALLKKEKAEPAKKKK